jgi:hypothetical protein
MQRRRRQNKSHFIQSLFTTHILFRMMVLLVVFIAVFGILLFIFHILFREPISTTHYTIESHIIHGSGQMLNSKNTVIKELKNDDSVRILSGETFALQANSKAELILQQGDINSVIRIFGPATISLPSATDALHFEKGTYFIKNNNIPLHITTDRSDIVFTDADIYMNQKEDGDHIALESGAAEIGIRHVKDNKPVIGNISIVAGQQMFISLALLENFLQKKYTLSSAVKAFDEAYFQDASRKQIVSTTFIEKSSLPIQEKKEEIKENTVPKVTSSNISSPKIIYPQNKEEIIGKKTILIEGEAPVGAHKIVVNGYTLQLFKPGNKTWNFLASPDIGIGNIIFGNNTLEVVAIDSKGKKSQPARITFSLYKNKAQVVREKMDSPTMIDPKIQNGGTFTATENSFLIKGTAPKGAHKIIVNGYTLQKFAPGNTTWKYFADSDIGTLKRGTNTYEIIALDAQGNKSKTLNITILYNLPDWVQSPTPAPAPLTQEPKVIKTSAEK